MSKAIPSHPQVRRGAAALGASVLLAVAAVAVATPATAATLEAYDADSWEDAVETAMANEGADTIVITADFAAPRGPQYTVDEDLTVDGQGHTVTWDGTDQGPFLRADANTTLDANLTLRNITLDGFGTSDTFSFGLASRQAILVDNVTVHQADGARPFFIYADGTATITDSTFTYTGSGATKEAVIEPYASSVGEVTIENSTFSDQSSDGNGALYLQDVDATVTGSTFSSNTSAEDGGAISATSLGSLTVEDSYFDSNEAGEQGGAIYSEVPLTVTGSLFAEGSAAGGSAISIGDASASVSIATSAFVSNTDTSALYSAGPVQIDSSLFVGNSTADSTGLLEINSDDSVDHVITNSTFTDNSTGFGVVVASSDDTISLLHNTFADNSSPNVADVRAFAPDVVLVGNVFASTSGTAACQIDTSEGAITATNFDVDGSCTDGSIGEGNIGTGLDPQLGELADNGGSLPTMEPASSSPLIDAIPVSQCSATLSDDFGDLLATDQRGVSRVEAVEDGNACDIGAVETYVRASSDDGSGDDGESDDGETNGTVTATITTPEGDVTVTVTGATSIKDTASLTVAQAGGTPAAGVAYPLGALGFTITTASPGDTVEVTLALPRPATGLWKTGGAWSEVDGATVSADGLTVTYTLTDGGDLDEDGAANGTIIDPAAPGVSATFTG